MAVVDLKTESDGIGPRDTLGRFTPGNPGGGRRPEYRSFRARAAEFMSDEGVELLIGMARNRDGFALRLLAEYAYGKPQQHVDVSGLDAGKVVFQIVYQEPESTTDQQPDQPALPATSTLDANYTLEDTSENA